MKFYYVDKDYVRYLKTIDNSVFNVDYDKNPKFVYGAIFDIDGKQYFAPVSSFKNQQKTNFLIYNNRKEPISSVRCSFMAPLPRHKITVVDIPNETDVKKRFLLNTEYFYLKKHEEDVKKLAKDVYQIGKDRSNFYAKNCCDFAKLEQEATLEGFVKYLNGRVGEQSRMAGEQYKKVQELEKGYNEEKERLELQKKDAKIEKQRLEELQRKIEESRLRLEEAKQKYIEDQARLAELTKKRDIEQLRLNNEAKKQQVAEHQEKISTSRVDAPQPTVAEEQKAADTTTQPVATMSPQLAAMVAGTTAQAPAADRAQAQAQSKKENTME